MRTDFDIRHKGRRYWAHRIGNKWNFWSDHKWPFYHGSFRTESREEALQAFHDWLPFEHR